MHSSYSAGTDRVGYSPGPITLCPRGIKVKPSGGDKVNTPGAQPYLSARVRYYAINIGIIFLLIKYNIHYSYEKLLPGEGKGEGYE